MSTTVRLSIGDWRPVPGETTHQARPRFTNPVPAAVTSGGRAIGELDAHLQWDGDALLARIPLPVLPGHALQARCALHERSAEEGIVEMWIEAISVVIDHLEDPIYGGFRADAPAIPAQRARVVDERVHRHGENGAPRSSDATEE